MSADVLLKNGIYKIEEIALIYSIYLGSPAKGRIDEDYQRVAMNECALFFQEFTVTKATGVFRGKIEDTLIFHIATSHPEKIIGLSDRLCECFCQDGIGVGYPTSQGSFYIRVVSQKK